MHEWVTLAHIADVPIGWATIIATVAGAFVAAGVPLIAVMFRRQTKQLRAIRADTKVARDQVANNHVNPETGEPINLREEQDERHAELVGRFDTIDATLNEHTRDIGGMRHDIRTLYASDGEQTRQQNRDRERIDQLEHTIPRNELGQFTKKENTE